MKFHPLEILGNVLLKPKTTFKIGGPARFFAECQNVEDLRQAYLFAKEHNLPVLLIGESSNMLVSDSGFSGLVVQPKILGKEVLEENSEFAVVKFSTGEHWDSAVLWACEKGFWGIENLSHIPGFCGSAVVQNIGAYGTQISDCLEKVEVFDTQTLKTKELKASECGLAYRKSIFNTTAKGSLVIVSITLKLSKNPKPNLVYSDLKTYFSEKPNPLLLEIRQAVIEIRNRKFPFPVEEKNGNTGSFFKNILLAPSEFANFEKKFKDNFSPKWQVKLEQQKNKYQTGESVKIPTAFLLEALGFCGVEMGRVWVNPRQPLVLLNLGGATAKEVLALAKRIRQTVFVKTGFGLELEPELVGFTKEELEEFYKLQ